MEMELSAKVASCDGGPPAGSSKGSASLLLEEANSARLPSYDRDSQDQAFKHILGRLQEVRGCRRERAILANFLCLVTFHCPVIGVVPELQVSVGYQHNDWGPKCLAYREWKWSQGGAISSFWWMWFLLAKMLDIITVCEINAAWDISIHEGVCIAAVHGGEQVISAEAWDKLFGRVTAPEHAHASLELMRADATGGTGRAEGMVKSFSGWLSAWPRVVQLCCEGTSALEVKLVKQNIAYLPSHFRQGHTSANAASCACKEFWHIMPNCVPQVGASVGAPELAEYVIQPVLAQELRLNLKSKDFVATIMRKMTRCHTAADKRNGAAMLRSHTHTGIMRPPLSLIYYLQGVCWRPYRAVAATVPDRARHASGTSMALTATEMHMFNPLINFGERFPSTVLSGTNTHMAAHELSRRYRKDGNVAGVQQLLLQVSVEFPETCLIEAQLTKQESKAAALPWRQNTQYMDRPRISKAQRRCSWLDGQRCVNMPPASSMLHLCNRQRNAIHAAEPP
eukprot:1160327-Pelagomonas_calceolata.AAC.3